MDEIVYTDADFFDPFQSLVIQEAKGDVWRVVCIKGGWSLNGVYYSPSALKEAVPLFDGVRVFAYQYNPKFFDHISDLGRETLKDCAKNLVGWISNPKYEKLTTGEGITGDFHVTDGKIRETFVNSWDQGKKDLLGFSIDGGGDLRRGTIDGRSGQIADKITKLDELTVVTNPAAGGKALRMVASTGGNMEENVLEGIKRKKLIAMLKDNPDILNMKEDVKIDEKSDEELIEALVNGLTSAKKKKKPEEENEKKKKEEEEKKKKMKAALDEVHTDLTETAMAFLSEDEEVDKDKIDEIKEAMISVDTGQLSKLAGLIAKKNVEEAKTLIGAILSKAYGKPYKKDKKPEDKEKAKEADSKALAEAKAMTEKLAKKMCAIDLKDALAESKLPEPVADKVKAQFVDKVFEPDELEKVIKAEKDVLAKLTESGQVKGMGDDLEMGDNTEDRVQKAMDLAIDPSLKYDKDDKIKESYKDAPKASIKELYVRLTGDVDVSGKKNPQRITESMASSDFTNILGTSMERRMLKEYKRLDAKSSWQKIATVENVDNFKTQEIIRRGGFANLSTVLENGEFTEFSTPSETKETYAVTKRGNLAVITREMIKNDDMRVFQKLATWIGFAANRTLNLFVFQLLIGSSDQASAGAINSDLMTDGYAVYDLANHANLTTTELNFSTLDAAITAIANQTEADSGEPLNIDAQKLVVPHELRSLAKILVESEFIPKDIAGSTHANNEINPVFKAVDPIVIPNYYLGNDANNWYVVGDAQGVTVGFLDGKQEPEILVQDAETVGTVFTHDRISYKVRHEYNGVMADYRGVYGGIVA